MTACVGLLLPWAPGGFQLHFPLDCLVLVTSAEALLTSLSLSLTPSLWHCGLGRNLS